MRPTEKGAPYLRFLAEQTRGFVEAYYATFAAVLSVEGTLTLKDLRKAAREQFERAQILGEADRPEADNQVTFANAVDLLVRSRILEPAPEAPKGEDAFVRGEAFGDLQAQWERMATALASR